MAAGRYAEWWEGIETVEVRVTGVGTAIDVEVELPEREAHRLPEQRRLLQSSLEALAVLAVNGQVR